ncbi:MAG: hypothetical protein GY694_06815 [Gammaproteobacteria bacterium]|nr:hypothetical protein [Gammaproteobacteria bacterium]
MIIENNMKPKLIFLCQIISCYAYEVLFSKHKGFLVFEVDQWRDATGHATIWDGAHCSDKCYFPIAQKAYLWILKN